MTLDESVNLPDLPFPPLRAGSNNAHLAWFDGGLSRINDVEVFGSVPGTKQANSWRDVILIQLETLVAPISSGN